MKHKIFVAPLSAFIAILLNLILFTSPCLAAISVIPGHPYEHQFSFELKPKEKKDASIIVQNFGAAPVDVSIYSADGTLSNQGTFALTSKQNQQNHIGKWITFTKNSETINPNEKKEIPFTITIPQDATPGTYSGGIAVESGNNKDKNSQVSITSRFVIKTFIQIPGEKVTKIDWNDFSLNQSNPSVSTFNLSYKNDGNTIIIADQKISINGFPQPTENTITPTSATILQKSSIDIPVRWQNKPEFGFFKAKADITFSEYDIINNKKINSVTKSKEIDIFIPIQWNSPLGLTIIIISLVIICFICYIISHIIITNKLKKISKTYTVQQDETIAQIALKAGISWKMLAKINNIKAPYTIKTGQKIIVPNIK